MSSTIDYQVGISNDAKKIIQDLFDSTMVPWGRTYEAYVKVLNGKIELTLYESCSGKSISIDTPDTLAVIKILPGTGTVYNICSKEEEISAIQYLIDAVYSSNRKRLKCLLKNFPNRDFKKEAAHRLNIILDDLGSMLDEILRHEDIIELGYPEAYGAYKKGMAMRKPTDKHHTIDENHPIWILFNATKEDREADDFTK